MSGGRRSEPEIEDEPKKKVAMSGGRRSEPEIEDKPKKKVAMSWGRRSEPEIEDKPKKRVAMSGGRRSEPEIEDEPKKKVAMSGGRRTGAAQEEAWNAATRKVALSDSSNSGALECSFAQKDRVMHLFTGIARGEQEIDIKVGVHFELPAFC